MVRVKRGVAANKRRKKILKQTKGFRWGRKSKYRLAKDALQHAGQYAYRDRKTKKRNFRKLWQLKINSACRQENISYSRLISGLKKNKIEIDRKIMAELIEKHPSSFRQITARVAEKKPAE